MAKQKADTSFSFGANAPSKPKFNGAPKSSSKSKSKASGKQKAKSNDGGGS